MAGALLRWFLHSAQIMGRIDERNVRKRLGEIADEPLGFGVVFLREEAYIVAQRQQSLEKLPCVLVSTE
jgi:hypothetical protein